MMVWALFSDISYSDESPPQMMATLRIFISKLRSFQVRTNEM